MWGITVGDHEGKPDDGTTAIFLEEVLCVIGPAIGGAPSRVGISFPAGDLASSWHKRDSQNQREPTYRYRWKAETAMANEKFKDNNGR